MHCQYCGKPILTFTESQTHFKECNMKVPEKFSGAGGADGYGQPYDKDRPYTPPPAKTHNAVLVDYVDLGEVEVDVYGKPGEKVMEHRAKFIYQLAEKMADGRRYLIAFKPFGVKVSLHEKAGFRQHLESLNGRTFEVGEDVEPEAFVGRPCVLLVVHKKNADGTKVYANIDTVAPHMDGLPVLAAEGYVRVKDRPKTGAAAAEAGGFSEPTAADPIPF